MLKLIQTAAALGAVTLTMSSSSALAAPHVAALHGRVVDSAGAPVANAAVTVYRDNSVLAQTTSAADGSFMFMAAPRAYRLVITAPGFGDLHSSPIPFRSSSLTRFTLMPPGMPAPAPTLVLDATNHNAWQFGAIAEGGVGLEDRSGYKFFNLGAQGGKVLTSNVGPGLLHGNFEYGIEVLPFWQSYTPRFQKVSCNADPGAPAGTYACSQPYTVGGTFTGVSIVPIQLRWNFTHGRRLMPWAQGGGGVVWTNHKYPPIGNTNTGDLASNGIHGDTSVWNFTPQFGIGTSVFVRPGQSIDLGAKAVHLSSASLGDKNPGVNTGVQFTLGYSWWK